MKIAITGIYPADRNNIQGGVEAVTLRLSEGLARIRGNEVHVIVTRGGAPESLKRSESNVLVHTITGSRKLGNILMAIPDRRRIARKIREIRPDIVHAHSTDRYALGAIESRFPAVVTIHGIIERESALETNALARIRGYFRNRLVGKALDEMQNVILLSNYVGEHYKRELSNARQWTIENPVADRFFESRSAEDSATVLHVGLLIPRKGIRNLVEGIGKARETVPEIQLRLAGSASDRAYDTAVRERVKSLGLEDAVEFLGGLSPDELADEYDRCAVLALVSKQETLPVAIQEGMAAGKPVVASPVGGIPDMVSEGKSGYLVPYGNPELLGKRLAELMADRTLRISMGREARRIAEKRFRMDSVCNRTMKAYEEVIDRF